MVQGRIQVGRPLLVARSTRLALLALRLRKAGVRAAPAALGQPAAQPPTLSTFGTVSGRHRAFRAAALGAAAQPVAKSRFFIQASATPADAATSPGGPLPGRPRQEGGERETGEPGAAQEPLAKAASLRPLAFRRRGAAFREEAAAEASPPLESRPILADFLAMGAGRASVAHASLAGGAATSASGSSVGRRHEEAEIAGDGEGATAMRPSDSGRGTGRLAVAFKERRLVVAALERGRAVEQQLSEAPPRVPVAQVLLRPRPMPALFELGYAGYLRQRAEPPSRWQLDAGKQGVLAMGEAAAAPIATASIIRAAAPDGAPNGAGVPAGAEEVGKELVRERGVVAGVGVASGMAIGSTPRSLRLRVMPWHREQLLKRCCHEIFYSFIEDRRSALGIRGKQDVLYNYEWNGALEHTTAGKVTALVRFLAETELHIAQGKERSSRSPGQAYEGKAKLQRERQLLARRWRVGARSLEEDAVVRVFLDGAASWSQVRSLLGAPLERAEPLGPVAA